MNRVETTKSLAAASRGAVWLKALDPEAKLLGELIPSVAAADGEIDGRAVRFMAVLPDPKNRYPRARKGEVGLLEGWAVAKSVLDFVQAESSQEEKTPLVLVIDVASQAYGRRKRRSAFTRRLQHLLPLSLKRAKSDILLWVSLSARRCRVHFLLLATKPTT